MTAGCIERAPRAPTPLFPWPVTAPRPAFLVQPIARPEALASLAHGAGRRYDHASMHGRVRGTKSDLAEMERNAFCGQLICEDKDLLIEEAPHAYKSADNVVADLEACAVAHRLARLNPLLTFKKTPREAQR